MSTLMKRIAWVSTVSALFLTLLYRMRPDALLLTLAITCGTIAYHFCMRLLVGQLFHHFMHNHADYTRPWYQLRPFEEKLYRKLQVRRWKKHLPTYDPDLFDKQKHSWEEIIGATCQAELVHETIAVLSFVPIFTIGIFGAPAVFVITSALSALFDLSFAALQRYNRPRIIRLACRKQINKK